MNLSKSLIQKVLPIATVVMFLLPFASAFGLVTISGFSCAFSLGDIWAILALICAVAAAVLPFIGQNRLSFFAFIALAVLLLIFGLSTGLGYMGIGWWLAILCTIGNIVVTFVMK